MTTIHFSQFQKLMREESLDAGCEYDNYSPFHLRFSREGLRLISRLTKHQMRVGGRLGRLAAILDALLAPALLITMCIVGIYCPGLELRAFGLAFGLAFVVRQPGYARRRSVAIASG